MVRPSDARISTRSIRCSRQYEPKRRQAAIERGSGPWPTERHNPAAAAKVKPRSRSLESEGRELGLVCRAGRTRLAADRASPPTFQFHHQPLNYSPISRPGPTARSEHLKDGGMNGIEFIKAIDAGGLPQVTFYKPQGNLKRACRATPTS